MIFTLKFQIINALIVCNIAAGYSQDSWHLAKNDQGIEVYVGSIPNSEYYGFKAIMMVNTTLANVTKVLKSIPEYPKWFAYTASVKLQAQTDAEQTFIMETDYPWPFSNECMNYIMTFQKTEKDGLKIKINGIQNNAHCRYSLKKANGYILIEPYQEQTRITYYLHSEPSQSIPPRLINPMIYKMPLQTFKALRKKLKP